MMWLHPSYILHVAVWKTPEEADILFTHQENGDCTPQDACLLWSLTPRQTQHSAGCRGPEGCRVRGAGLERAEPGQPSTLVGRGPQPQPLMTLPSVLNLLLPPACFLSHRSACPKSHSPRNQTAGFPPPQATPSSRHCSLWPEAGCGGSCDSGASSCHGHLWELGSAVKNEKASALGRTHYVEPLQGAGLTVVRMVPSGPPLLCALGLVEETRAPWSFPELRRGPGEAGRWLAAVEQGQMDHFFEGMRAAGRSPPDPAWCPGSDSFQFP